MSLLNWFGRKAPAPPERTAGGRTGSAAQGADDQPVTDTATRLKTERARLRELLYNVVRESMVRVGVLSSSFKFKVLATDIRGREFIVMMDLSPDFASQLGELTEIETLICQTARSRYDIVVSAVYWRANDQVASSPRVHEAVSSRPSVAAEAASPRPAPVMRRPEAVQEDEIRELQRVLATATAPVAPAAARAAVPAAPPKPPAAAAGLESTFPPTTMTGYEATEIQETQVMDNDDPLPNLSPTQYGELR